MRTKTLVQTIVVAGFSLVAASGCAWAQTTGAEARLKELGIILEPERLPSSRVNFVNAVRAGNLLFMAGTNAGPQSTMKGKVGRDLTVDQGYEAARFVGILMLSKIRSAAGSLDHVKRVVKILGMVNAAEGFTDAGLVINGFSDLFVAVFGEAVGKHARSSVGVASLGFNTPVEVEVIVEVE